MQQDYKVYPIRSASSLTTSYVAGTVISFDGLVDSKNQLIVNYDLTLGSLTSAELIVEFSADNSDYFQETFGKITDGVEVDTPGYHQFIVSGKGRIPIEIKDRCIKISVKGTGDISGSSMRVMAVIGIA